MHCVGLLLHGRGKSAFDPALISGLDDQYLQPETMQRGRKLLDVILHEAGIIGIHKERNPGNAASDLMQ